MTIALVDVEPFPRRYVTVSLYARFRRLHGDDPADPLPDFHLIDRQTPDVTDRVCRHLVRRCEGVETEDETELGSIDVADSRHHRLIEK